METAIESQPLLGTAKAVECLHQITLQFRLFDLFSLCWFLIIAALVAVLEYSQLLGDSFKRAAAGHAVVFILLPLMAVVQVLITPSRSRLPLVLKWLLVLGHFLAMAMMPTDASDATESTNTSLLAASYVICTYASMLIIDSMTPTQLLNWRATAGIAATVTAVVMVSLYAWGQLGSLTLLDFLVLLLVESILAGWCAFHATKIYATIGSIQVAEAGQAIEVAEQDTNDTK